MNDLLISHLESNFIDPNGYGLVYDKLLNVYNRHHIIK